MQMLDMGNLNNQVPPGSACVSHKRRLAAFATAICAAMASLPSSAACASRTIHVAPMTPGAENDVRDGSAARPFSSPLEAQTALRARMAAEGRGGWVVEIAPGEYPLSEPFTFTPDDSGLPDATVVWRGPADGSAHIVGARDLAGWRVRPDGRWEADIPVRQMERYQTLEWFEQLYVNGRRAKRARHPNAGFLPVKSAKPTLLAGDLELMEMEAMGGDLAPLASCSPAALRLAHLVVHHKWSSTRRPIRAYDASRGVVVTEGRSVAKWNTWNNKSMYYIENAPFALDEPGEWLYDGAARKIVYIPRPGETLETTRFQYPVPGLVTLLRIAGNPAADIFVHDIAFENISFEFSDSPRRARFGGRKGVPEGELGDASSHLPSEWPGAQSAVHTLAAVLADGAQRISLRGCKIANVGEYGVWLREGCVSNRIERCSITDMGAGGVRIGTPGATQTVSRGERVKGLANGRGTGYNVVEDCTIAHGGRIHAEGVGVWIGASPFNSVVHCEIADFFYTGVSIGWVWGYAGSLAQGNTLAFCRVHDIGQRALSDMGGIYTLGTSYGTRVANNIVFNVDSRSYGGWGLYADEGSEGIVFENNLVYDTKDASFHQHFGKGNILRNNILAFSRQGQIALSRPERHLSFTAERNVVYWDSGPVFTKYVGTLRETGRIAWKGNFWWMTSGEPSFNRKTFAQWQAKGNDRDGLVADPLFFDAAKRDFRLKPESPVVKAGFRPFDIGAAGVRPLCHGCPNSSD